MEIKLVKPITIDEKEIKKIDLKLEDLTGEDILNIDTELRVEGHVRGIDDVFSQKVLLKMASKSSGIIADDLKKLSATDFLDVTFSVKNFLLGFSEPKDDQENSEES